MLRSILKQFISKRKFRISLEKGHFRSLEKKGRGLDPQDPPVVARLPDREGYLLLCILYSHNYDVIALGMNFLEIFLCPGFSPFDSFTWLFITDRHICTSASVYSKLCCRCRRFYISRGVYRSINSKILMMSSSIGGLFKAGIMSLF